MDTQRKQHKFDINFLSTFFRFFHIVDTLFKYNPSLMESMIIIINKRNSLVISMNYLQSGFNLILCMLIFFSINNRVDV